MPPPLRFFAFYPNWRSLGAAQIAGGFWGFQGVQMCSKHKIILVPIYLQTYLYFFFQKNILSKIFLAKIFFQKYFSVNIFANIFRPNALS